MAAIALVAGFILYYAVTRILISDVENSLIRFSEQAQPQSVNMFMGVFPMSIHG